jgi:hypothetical protein
MSTETNDNQTKKIKNSIMKKLFIATLLSVTVAASAFAKDTKKVNYIAASNFKVEYAKASDVSWITTPEYTKASFVLNNEKMDVFYNANGEKFATSTNVTVDELPVKAKRSLAKNYATYTIKEVIEFEGTDDSGYYISAENQKESVVLKVSSAGELIPFQSSRK